MDAIQERPASPRLADWLFGLLLIEIGAANLLLVHPVPAAGYMIASLLYLPSAQALFKRHCGLSIHPAVRIALGIAMVMFTLGVSDRGDTID